LPLAGDTVSFVFMPESNPEILLRFAIALLIVLYHKNEQSQIKKQRNRRKNNRIASNETRSACIGIT
jgi:uncharacterized membrane protein